MYEGINGITACSPLHLNAAVQLKRLRFQLLRDVIHVDLFRIPRPQLL